MIDPWNITKYDRTDAELEEMALFCVAVAGKQADVIARKVAAFLDPRRRLRMGVLEYVWHLAETNALDCQLRLFGISPYGTRCAGFAALARAVVVDGMDLRLCHVDWLCTIPGIGPKTSRFFVLHSRAGARHAVIDTHILKYLAREHGYDAPKQTPHAPSEYAKWENVWLNICDDCKVTPAVADQMIWIKYADAYRAARRNRRG